MISDCSGFPVLHNDSCINTVCMHVLVSSVIYCMFAKFLLRSQQFGVNMSSRVASCLQ